MKVPTSAEPIIPPRIVGGLSIEPMVFTTPSTAATMPSAGKRIGQVLQRVLRFVQFVEVGLHRIVHDVLDRVDLQRAGGDHDQRQRVADQVDQRFVGEQAGKFGKERR